MGEGWIKLHRKIKKWEWFDNPTVCYVWFHLLVNANWEDKQWQGMTIKRGQLIIGVESFGKSINLKRQPTRTALTNLQKTNELTIKTTNKYTIVTINNYDKYQHLTIKKPANPHQKTSKLTTTKEYKNIRSKEITTYVETFNKLFKTSFKETAGRKAKLSQRLKTFPLKDVLKALDNLSKSSWHRGDNDSNWRADPDFLIRNDEQVDKWLNINPRKINNSPKGVNYEDLKPNL